jgi:two-component system, NtrC family, C4-dicarboxylate transport response regulator DctD
MSAMPISRQMPQQLPSGMGFVVTQCNEDPTEPGPLRHVMVAPRRATGAWDAALPNRREASDTIDLSRKRSTEARTASTPATIVGQAPAIQRLRSSVERMARIPVDVLLIGETGTGKDLVLQQLHALSGRPGALVAVNCGAIPDGLFESELFGHESGSFTGANKSRPGKFEQAHRGTLFLDEIDSMPMHQQVKLLRVLETRCVDRVGGRGESALDLRVVAACQGRLEERCRLGQFRLDLWHRLNVVTLEIPALRDRREDILPLFWHYVDEACARYGVVRDSLPVVDTARLVAHGWLGNVRELKHAAERFVLSLNVLPGDAVNTGEAFEVGDATGLESHMARCERELITAALARHGRRLAAAATELAVSEKTLSRRIAAYKL